MSIDKLIKFKKNVLDNLKHEGKDEFYFAENFQGLCICINKGSKAYYDHWAVPKIDKATGSNKYRELLICLLFNIKTKSDNIIT